MEEKRRESDKTIALLIQQLSDLIVVLAKQNL
jgi:hypothetical protein